MWTAWNGVYSREPSVFSPMLATVAYPLPLLAGVARLGEHRMPCAPFCWGAMARIVEHKAKAVLQNCCKNVWNCVKPRLHLDSLTSK